MVGENEPVYCATVLETPDQNLTLAEVTRIASIDIIFTPNPDVEPVSLQLKGFSETGSMTTSDGLRLSNSDGSPLVYLEGRVGINNSVFGNFSEPLEVYVRKDAQVNIDDSERSENEIEFDAEFIESELSSANRQ